MNFAIATLTDDSYIIGTKILIYSFLKNNPWFDGDICIIYDFLNNIYIEDLKKIYTNIKFVCVNPEKYSEVNK
jgi:lipopolysaccharide biosynthesis glycosyltransferase